MPEANVRERIDGYAAFVRKPFNLDAMVHLVARILETLPAEALRPYPDAAARGGRICGRS